MVLNKFSAELTTTNGIIAVGLIYKRSVDISTEKVSVAMEPLISSLDPHVKTYIMGDFNINPAYLAIFLQCFTLGWGKTPHQ